MYNAVTLKCEDLVTEKTMSELDCKPGFYLKHNTCIDFDECVHEKDACSYNEVCVNEVGGYKCNCNTGFKHDPITSKCVGEFELFPNNSLISYLFSDINECQVNNHNCLSTQKCENTIGSYTCVRTGCEKGYAWNAEKKDCDGE